MTNDLSASLPTGCVIPAAIDASFGALADDVLEPLDRSPDERAAHLERIRAL